MHASDLVGSHKFDVVDDLAIGAHESVLTKVDDISLVDDMLCTTSSILLRALEYPWTFAIDVQSKLSRPELAFLFRAGRAEASLQLVRL